MAPDSDTEVDCDFDPRAEVDADGDGVYDFLEPSAEPDIDEDGLANPVDPDSDGDGIPDQVEAAQLTRCDIPIDSDGDGLVDMIDTDSDDDGVPDAVEWITDGLDWRLPDSDEDGCPDGVVNEGLECGPHDLVFLPCTDPPQTRRFLSLRWDGPETLGYLTFQVLNEIGTPMMVAPPATASTRSVTPADGASPDDEGFAEVRPGATVVFRITERNVDDPAPLMVYRWVGADTVSDAIPFEGRVLISGRPGCHALF